MYHLFIFLVLLAVTNGQNMKIEGSKVEVVKISNEVGKPFTKFMEELAFDKLGKVCEPNVIMIANGHKPLKGKTATEEVVKKFEEWGPGMSYTPKEILISKSKDMGIVMGTGSYKKIEKITYLSIFKKFNNRWLLHMSAFHQWPKKVKDKKRTKRSISGNIKPDIIGNNTAAVTEGQKLLKVWVEHFQSDSVKKLLELYSDECIVLDNKHSPKKGKKLAEKIYKKVMSKYGKNMEIAVFGISTSIEGDFVAAYGTWKDGNSLGNYLRVMKREGGKLKIRYDMFSHETGV